jgi:hypothetical protein
MSFLAKKKYKITTPGHNQMTTPGHNQIKHRSYANTVKLPLMLLSLMDRLPTDLVGHIQTFVVDLDESIEKQKYLARRLLISIHPELYFTMSVLESSLNMGLSDTILDFITRNYNGTRFSVKSVKPVKAIVSEVDVQTNQTSEPDTTSDHQSIDDQSTDALASRALSELSVHDNRPLVKYHRKLTKTEYKLSNLEKRSKATEYLDSKAQMRNAKKENQKKRSKLMKASHSEKFVQMNGSAYEINHWYYDDIEVDAIYDFSSYSDPYSPKFDPYFYWD